MNTVALLDILFPKPPEGPAHIEMVERVLPRRMAQRIRELDAQDAKLYDSLEKLRDSLKRTRKELRKKSHPG